MSSTTPVAPPGVFPPPPGVTPNFIDPPQHTLGLVPLIIIFTLLSTVFLALRLFTKAHILRVLGWEDVVIVIAWMGNVTLMGLYIKGLQLGAGSHVWNFKMVNYPLYARLANAAILLYSPLVGLPKIAILHFYLRLSPSRIFRFNTIATIVFVWAYIIGILLVQLFACNPVKKLWEPLIEGKCINQRPIYLVIPIVGTVLDLLVILIPLPMLVRLRVNTRMKVTVIGIFTICSCTCVVSAMRIWSTSKLLAPNDLTWDAAISNVLTVVEVNMMVVCGSVLVLRPFCRRYLPFLLGSERHKHQHNIRGLNEVVMHDSPNYDGPLGPRSKNHYHTRVSSGGAGGLAKKRTLFGIGWGFTTLLEEEDDLESLRGELKRLPPTGPETAGNNNTTVASKNTYDDVEGSTQGGTSEVEHAESSGSTEEIGVARSEPPEHETVDLGDGIVKTMSLDVRGDRQV